VRAVVTPEGSAVDEWMHSKSDLPVGLTVFVGSSAFRRVRKSAGAAGSLLFSPRISKAVRIVLTRVNAELRTLPRGVPPL